MSVRSQIRREERDRQRKGKVYHLTQSQINNMKVEITKQVIPEATEKAFKLMMGISCSVLAEVYWPKTGKKRIPEFLEEVFKLYESVESGVVTQEEIDRQLWKYGGMRIEL